MWSSLSRRSSLLSWWRLTLLLPCALVPLGIPTMMTVTPGIVGVEALLSSPLRARRHAASRQRRKQHEPRVQEQEYDDVVEEYMEQRLDHFDIRPTLRGGNVPKTFGQRYFYTERYVHDEQDLSLCISNGKGRDPPQQDDEVDVMEDLLVADDNDNYSDDKDAVARPTYAFLCVGGEGPSLDKSVLADSVHCTGDMIELAKRLYEDEDANVHLFALEHRYYGKSYPKFGDSKLSNYTSPITNEHLIYLSSRQAQSDLAHFISTMNKCLARGTRWVTFGGSYPGMMAGWARLKFPHLVYAALSSSSPMKISLRFPQYLEHVAFVLQYEAVGGSDQCLDIVQQGHADLVHLLVDQGGNDNREYAAGLFNVCQGPDELIPQMNIQQFLGDGVIEIDVQDNDPNCNSTDLCNIEKLCNAIIDEYEARNSSAMEALGAIAKRQRQDECVKVDWQETLAYFASPDNTDFLESGDRSWLWQTCTEFGFYQTCDIDSSCPYGRGLHTLEQDLELCRVAFGIPADVVTERVAESLEEYGGWHMGGSRIMFVNGDVDPWSVLAITGDRGDTVLRPTLWVRGASHHFWTHPSRDSDSPEVVDSREIIHRQVMTWIEEGENDGPTQTLSRVRVRAEYE